MLALQLCTFAKGVPWRFFGNPHCKHCTASFCLCLIDVNQGEHFKRRAHWQQGLDPRLATRRVGRKQTAESNGPFGSRSGKIGGAGLDVVEGEDAYFHTDWSSKVEAWSRCGGKSCWVPSTKVDFAVITRFVIASCWTKILQFRNSVSAVSQYRWSVCQLLYHIKRISFLTSSVARLHLFLFVCPYPYPCRSFVICAISQAEVENDDLSVLTCFNNVVITYHQAPSRLEASSWHEQSMLLFRCCRHGSPSNRCRVCATRLCEASMPVVMVKNHHCSATNTRRSSPDNVAPT